MSFNYSSGSEDQFVNSCDVLKYLFLNGLREKEKISCDELEDENRE